MSAADRELLSALLDHSVAPRILDLHLDSCEDDACQGCDPQHLAQVAAAARLARAEEHLAACATEAGMTPDEYCRQGLLLEWHHQIDDPAVPAPCYRLPAPQSGSAA